MAQACGLGMISISNALQNLQPDCIVIIGDRYEMMAATLSAAFMNIPILHSMGGEVTGTIDESNRHAITKYANYHFVANENAKNRVIKLGEPEDHVFNIGCPLNDTIRKALDHIGSQKEYLSNSMLCKTGVGVDINFETEPFIIFSYHPVTTEYKTIKSDFNKIINAIEDLSIKVIALWPNADAGSDEISQIIRMKREKSQLKNFRFYRNLELNDYIACMNNAKCIIGNSSSGLRDGSFIGTPCVNIGTRQNMRDKGSNVIEVPIDKEKIICTAKQQISIGKFKRDTLYGDGYASRRFSDLIGTLDLSLTQKVITY